MEVRPAGPVATGRSAARRKGAPVRPRGKPRRPLGDGSVILSSGARIRPRKPLRAAPRCTVLGMPGSAAFLARTDARAAVAPAPPVLRRHAVAPPSTDARFYRRLDTAVTVGGVALLGALGSFMIGERLLSHRASTSPLSQTSALPPPAAPSPASAEAVPGAVSPPVTGAPAYGPARSAADPALARALFGRSAVQTPFDPPWRDVAAMRQGNSSVSVESFSALVLDNRRLGAEVVALEAETTSLQQTLLYRELQLFAAGLPIGDEEDPGAPFDGDGVPAASAPSVPLSEPFPDEPPPNEPLPNEPLPPTEGELASLSGLDDESRELELFASDDMTYEPIESYEVGDQAIASAAMGAPQQRLVIATVNPGGVAESIGLLPGDILLALNGEEVFGMDGVIPRDEGSQAGRSHELTIVRDGARFPVPYTGDPSALSLRLDWVDPVFSER